MKKYNIPLICILVVFIIFLIATRNVLVVKREEVQKQKSNIETQLQRRMDLIPNLLVSLKSYMSHEEEIYTKLADARVKLAEAINSGDITKMADANKEISTLMGDVLVISENYPELSSNEQFIGFQDELAGTENRIAVARRYYNEAVADYNTSLEIFPTVVAAKLFDFERMEGFEASAGADTVPVLDFN